MTGSPPSLIYRSCLLTWSLAFGACRDYLRTSPYPACWICYGNTTAPSYARSPAIIRSCSPWSSHIVSSSVPRSRFWPWPAYPRFTCWSASRSCWVTWLRSPRGSTDLFSTRFRWICRNTRLACSRGQWASCLWAGSISPPSHSVMWRSAVVPGCRIG